VKNPKESYFFLISLMFELTPSSRCAVKKIFESLVLITTKENGGETVLTTKRVEEEKTLLIRFQTGYHYPSIGVTVQLNPVPETILVIME
jgi:hypothetical protein